MNGVQRAFLQQVDAQRKAHRPHANYVKEFERRAAKDPKSCAEEALIEVLTSARMLSQTFKKAFGEDFEDAFRRVFDLTPEGQQALREDAQLPENPLAQEFFLIWLYWLHFYKVTMDYFLRCLSAPDGPHERHARAMCACFVRHELASRFACFLVADDVLRRFPNRDLKTAFVEDLTGYFIVHTSLRTNKRLGTRIAELKEPGESNYERLIQEMSGEVWNAWRERRSAWKPRAFNPDQVMEMRSEIARRLEGRTASSSETDLGTFADREKRFQLLKRGREAGLTPREHELFGLVVSDPKRFLRNGKLNHNEAAQEMGVAVGTIKSLWSRTMKTLRAS
jgi:hypothetical protein